MPDQASLFTWGTPVERERRRRILLSLWAYAYELRSAPMVTDETFDRVARESRRYMITGLHDEWWRIFFAPHTGQWVHAHPDLDGINRLWSKLNVSY